MISNATPAGGVDFHGACEAIRNVKKQIIYNKTAFDQFGIIPKVRRFEIYFKSF